MKRKPTSRSKSITLSLVLPVYNESLRLGAGLASALTYLSGQRYQWEIILVDDGSDKRLMAHGSWLMVDNIKYYKFGHELRATSNSLKIIRLVQNVGKGGAIAAGVKEARGKYIVFSDIDLSVPLAHLAPMLRLLESHPVVIASRRLPTSYIVTHQPLLRELSGRVFTWLANTLCGIGVADATCGLKGFQREVARTLFEHLTISRWVFDVELLSLARRFGYDIKEMPVAWADRAGTKVRGRDMLWSLIDLLRIRWNDRGRQSRISNLESRISMPL